MIDLTQDEVQFVLGLVRRECKRVEKRGRAGTRRFGDEYDTTADDRRFAFLASIKAKLKEAS